MALLAMMVGVGLAGYGTLRFRDAQAKPGPTEPQVSATPTGPTEPRVVTILAAGDIIGHTPIWQQARDNAQGDGYDFNPMFEHISATISAADLALCQFDMPVTTAGSTPSGFPLFNTPPEILGAIKKAGFDGCSTAGNHALDRGSEGVTRTLAAMDAADLGHTGTARTAEEAGRPEVYEVQGVKVAHLSYSYGYGVKPPTGKEWMANVTDAATIKAAAKNARAVGAELVVLSLHWGAELTNEPNDDQETMAADLMGTPEIDLIFGHHTHSVQVMEKVNQKWVVYGLGNQLARHSEGTTESREGIMALMTLTEETPGQWRVTKAEAIPTWTEFTPKIRILELPKIVADQSVSSAARRFHQATLDRIIEYLNLRGNPGGVIIRGATPGGSASPSAG